MAAPPQVIAPWLDPDTAVETVRAWSGFLPLAEWRIADPQLDAREGEAFRLQVRLERARRAPLEAVLAANFEIELDAFTGAVFRPQANAELVSSFATEIQDLIDRAGADPAISDWLGHHGPAVARVVEAQNSLRLSFRAGDSDAPILFPPLA